MCETRDLGVTWPQWLALIFEGQVRVDIRYVCPKDVKKMLLKQARSALLDEVGSEAGVRRIEGRYMARASGCAAEEDEGRMD